MARMLAGCCAAALAALCLPAGAAAVNLSPGFQQRTVFSGLTLPTAARFAPDGRVFVAEKSGRILAFDGLDDADRTEVINLQRDVYNFSDRGLLGLAVDPAFPARPYLYASYTRDALPGGSAPHWGSGPDYENEDCPGTTTPSSACVVTGRLVKIEIDPTTNLAVGSPQTLIDDWCQQFLSHSVGDLAFAADGQLYASGGDGAHYDDVDYGQHYGNPCGDPVPRDGFGQIASSLFTDPFTGAPSSVLEAEGGALRSQDLRTMGDPAGLDGTIIRIDPDTGAASAGNPLGAIPDPNARRIVADGLRNPLRFAVRPGSGDIWIGDVGWGDWEEVNRLPNPASPGAGKKNFGWPCYEGDGLPGSRVQNLYRYYRIGICERLYGAGDAAVTPPVFAYSHDQHDTDTLCEPARGGELVSYRVGSSVTGMAFYTTGDYGAGYEGGLFFADYSRRCVWFMGVNEDGPDPSKVQVFAENADFPVDVQRGPGGDIFYVNIVGGEVLRIERSDLSVSLAADRTYGPAPLDVRLTAGTSGGQGPLTYTWDFNGDGEYGDDGVSAGSVTRSFPQRIPGVRVRVRVTDTGNGHVGTSAPVLIAAGNIHPPAARIDAPEPALTWAVGQKVEFAGTGVDADEPGGSTPAKRMRWDVILQHCPGGCHQHFLRSFEGTDSGSFTTVAHEYPSRLTLRLTVTDEYGMKDTRSIELEPQTVALGVLSSPAGRSAAINLTTGTTPLRTTVIRGSTASVATEQVQEAAGRSYVFDGWSNGGARLHTLVVLADTTLTARFLATPVFGAVPEVTGTATVGRTLTASDGSPDGGAAVTISRRWQRCDAAGAACADILGATATAYTTVTADVGRRLRVQVAAQNGAGSASAASAPTAKVTAVAVRRGAAVRTRRDGTAALRVRCPFTKRCTGTLVLTRPGAAGRLARATLRIGARRTLTVRLRLSRSALALLARRRSLQVQSTLTLTPAGGSPRITLTRFTLLAPRR